MGPFNPGEFEELFEAHADRMVLYARQWVDRETAEDVVQDVFVKLMQVKKRPTALKPWLYRLVRNRAISRLRSGGRRARRDGTAREQDQPGWFRADPDALLDIHETQQLLQSLAEPNREVVMLRIWGDLTINEVSKVTSLAPSTVLRRYKEGLHEIRTKLGESCRSMNS
jgi:RNA polymerase sigma factor (sigma-70 family)